MSIAKKIFYAEATKGYIIKVIIDTLCGGGIGRGIFVIEKSGIILRQSDQGSTILYDVNLPCMHLKNYKCQKPMVISVNLKHMQGLLKTVKKKDCVSMHIEVDQPGKLYITIRPEGSREITRFETKSIAYQIEEGYVLTELPDGGYKYPMVINASDFQKVKQLAMIDKKITITIQRSNYLTFKCDAGNVMDSILGFGQYQEDDLESSNEDGCKLCGNELDECWCECEVCESYIAECWCECGECGEYKTSCTCVGDGIEKGIFSAEYYSKSLNKLVKVPGLCAQMQFYAPLIPRYPLKIEVSAGQSGFTIGKLQVYIKDADQINYEASLQKENDNIVQITKTKTKIKKNSD